MGGEKKRRREESIVIWCSDKGSNDSKIVVDRFYFAQSISMCEYSKWKWNIWLQ